MEYLEIVKYILPSAVVFITAFYMLKTMLNNEQKKLSQELRSNNQKIITPIRLQAYERVVLFLERISPDSIILRVQKPKMNCSQLQSGLLSVIRSEYEHNLSQQIYISGGSWEVVKSAKENMVKLINSAAMRVKPDDPAIKLSQVILEAVMEMETSPTKLAINIVKKEASQVF